MQDYDEDGKLSFSEFSDLMNAFGNIVAANKVWPSAALSPLSVLRASVYVFVSDCEVAITLRNFKYQKLSPGQKFF